MVLDFRRARGDAQIPRVGLQVSLHAGFGSAFRLRRRVRVADQGHRVHDLTPEEVSKGIAEARYLLVDVREPNEVAADAYPGAVVVPLSSFDPASIPDPKGRQVVFACRSGKRSVTASLSAQAAGFAYDKHLAGGMLAWKAAGLPTKSDG
jgi:rhodanese-related sulfurtransferase